jgi:hypothetical protein
MGVGTIPGILTRPRAVSSMAKVEDEFFELAIRRFDWLTGEYGFKVRRQDIKKRGSTPLYCSVLWSNSQLFVEAILEFPRPRLDIQFGTLRGGLVPGLDDIDHRFDLSQLLAVSGNIKLAGSVATLDGLRRRQIDRGLKQSSALLTQLAADLFAGDISRLKELNVYARFVREHNRQTLLGHP